jgi:hypothetical protein
MVIIICLTNMEEGEVTRYGFTFGMLLFPRNSWTFFHICGDGLTCFWTLLYCVFVDTSSRPDWRKNVSSMNVVAKSVETKKCIVTCHVHSFVWWSEIATPSFCFGSHAFHRLLFYFLKKKKHVGHNVGKETKWKVNSVFLKICFMNTLSFFV